MQWPTNQRFVKAACTWSVLNVKESLSIYIYINGHDLASSHCHVRIPEGNIDNLQLPRKVKTEFVRLNAAGSGKGNNSHEHSIDEEYRQQRHQFAFGQQYRISNVLVIPSAWKTHIQQITRSLCSFALVAKLAPSEDCSPMQMSPIMSGELVNKCSSLCSTLMGWLYLSQVCIIWPKLLTTKFKR